nr:uncharacterized protein LOC129261993 [Lytechinus pictus]
MIQAVLPSDFHQESITFYSYLQQPLISRSLEMKRSSPQAGRSGKILSPRSSVWQFMELNRETRRARCRFCEKILAYTGGTTNLRYHLTAAHSMEEFEVIGPSAKIFKPGGRTPGSGKKKIPKLKDHPSTSRTSAIKDLKKTPTKLTPVPEEMPNTPPSTSSGHLTMPSLSPIKANIQKQKMEEGEMVIAPKLLHMMAQSLQPLSFIYSEGFRSYMRSIEPVHKIPRKQKLLNNLIVMYEETKIQLKEILAEEVVYFSLVYDLWSGSDQELYTTVRIHYLTNQWERKSYVLGTEHVSRAETNNNEICLYINDLMFQYGLPSEHLVAILNRQGMMKPTAMEVGATLVCESMGCAAEKLEMCVLEAFKVPEVRAVVERAGKLVSYLIFDEEANRLLQELKESDPGKLMIDLVQDHRGSWIATSEMLFKLMALRPVVERVCGLDPKSEELLLSEPQWRLAEKLVSSLQILRAALAVMSKDRTGSVSCLLPVVHSILQHCEDSSHGPNSPMERFLKTIGRETRSKWDLTAILPSSVPMLAALLDPRFKKLKFIAEEDKVDVLLALKSVMLASPGVADGEGGNNQSGDSKESSPFLCLFGNGEEEGVPDKLDIDSEINSYMDFPALRHDSCPLDWWRVNRSRFPNLVKLAKQFLCMPAIAQPMSDIMAGATMLDLKRAVLETEVIAPLIFLNHNWSLTQL